jgi:hypothetical protein
LDDEDEESEDDQDSEDDDIEQTDGAVVEQDDEMEIAIPQVDGVGEGDDEGSSLHHLPQMVSPSAQRSLANLLGNGGAGAGAGASLLGLQSMAGLQAANAPQLSAFLAMAQTQVQL